MSASTHKADKISIVVSVYNEEQMLPLFWKELSSCLQPLPSRFEVFFVNDGSADQSQQEIQKIVASSDSMPNIQVNSLEFSRNFGHEAAMIAGIDHASGDAIICLDADLQHPPAKIGEMMAKFEQGNDIIMMHREKRADQKGLNKFLSRWFYQLLNMTSEFSFEEAASDFFLISKSVAQLLRQYYREQNRFIRGLIQIVGFNKCTLYYEADKRLAGDSSYSLRNLFSLAFVAFTSFSIRPLQISIFVALLFILFSFVVTVFSLLVYFFGETPPSGYTTLVVFISICFTILYSLLAILSIYIGYLFREIKRRPLYIVKNAELKPPPDPNVINTSDSQ
ncbi:MAG: glycosyltransferase family 2 protein [Bacteroidota bacterium]